MPIEYKVISLTWGGSLPILEDELNRYGADGWDVVDLRWQQGSHDFVAVTMKREMPLVKWRHESGKEAVFLAGVAPDTHPAEAAKWENLGPSAPADTSDA